MDLFFDILCPEMNLKGIISFYYYSFEQVNDIVKQYFEPSFNAIAHAGCFDTIEGPIMNVLRKAFQTTYTEILRNLQKKCKI